MKASSAQPCPPLARVAFSALLCLVLPATSQAEAVTLASSPSAYTYWEYSTDWIPARVPTIDDDVFVGVAQERSAVSVSGSTTKPYSAYAGSLSIGSLGGMHLRDATLDIRGQLSQAGTLQLLYGSKVTALGGAVLKSGGKTQLTSGDAPVIWPLKPTAGGPFRGATLSTGQSTLSIESGHTLYGSGIIQSPNIINRGEILSEGWLMIGRTDNTGGLIGSSLDRKGTLLTTDVVSGGTIQGNVNGTFSGVNIISASGRFNLVGDITNNGQMIVTFAKGITGAADPGVLIGQPGVFIQGQGTILAKELKPVLIQDIGFGSGQVFVGGAKVKGQLINQGRMEITLHDLSADTTATATWINQGRMDVYTAITGAVIDNTQGVINLNGKGGLNGSHVRGGTVNSGNAGQLGHVKLENLSTTGEFFVWGATEFLGRVRNMGNLVVEAGGQLIVRASDFTNEKLISIRSGGLLFSDQTLNNEAGRIAGETNARLHGVVIRGGKIGAAYPYSGATFQSSGHVHLSDIQVNDALSFFIRDSIALSGQIDVSNQFMLTGDTSDGQPALVNVNGSTVLSGQGATTLSANVVLQTAGNLDALTIASGHTLTALGNVHATVINRGTLKLGEGKSQLIRNELTNTGKVYVAAQTSVQAIGGINNQDGLIEIGQNAQLQAMAIGLGGGTVHGTQPGSRLWASELRDVRITGDVTLGGTATSISSGTTVKKHLTVDGRLQIGEATAGLIVAGDVVLQGAGTTAMQGKQATIEASPQQGLIGPTLTIAAEHSLHASGRITNVQLINKGQVLIEHADLHLAESRTSVNQGQLVVRLGQLTVDGSLRQDEDAATLVIDRGGVHAASTQIEKGQMILREASFEGNLTLGEGADVWLDMSGQTPSQTPFARIQGSLALAGTLTLSFKDLSEVAESYFLFESTSETITGTFKQVIVQGTAQDYKLSIEAGKVYAVRSATAVPEPATLLLTLAGFAALAWQQRRKPH